MPMSEVMHKFKAGKLRSGSGERVTSRKQAIAIGMHTEHEPKMRDMMRKRKMPKGMGGHAH